jgi:hypothetical protein
MSRSILAFGLLIGLCASANAAKLHHGKPPEGHLHGGQPVTAPGSYAVPGWTEQETRRWLDDATGPKD